MSTLLPQYLMHLRAAGYSARTMDDRERLLRSADRELPSGLDTPTTEELAEFLATPGWSAWTRCTYYGHLVGLYRWASTGQRPRLNWNPATDLKRPKSPDADPDPVTDAELEYALTHSSDWWQLAIALAAYAGLRASEIGRIRREDVSAETILIRHGKGNRTKQLPMHPEIWRRAQPRPPGLLLPSRAGTEVILTVKARIHFDRIGMPDVHLHRFRHWYATSLLRNGADIVTVQKLMRHRSLQTTAGYLEIVDGQRRLAVGTLPVFTDPQQEAA